MEILSNDKCLNSIQWCSDGKAFEISNPRKFAANILPVYFKNSKYTSFTRKLYRWGFQMKDLQHKNSFYNKNFLRDREDLLSKMYLHYSPKELRVKRTKKRINKSSVIRMLKTDKCSFAQCLQSGAISNNLQSRSQSLNTHSNMQVPQASLTSTIGKKSFARSLESGASFNDLRSRSQALNAASLTSTYATLKTPSQQPPQHFLHTPSFSSLHSLPIVPLIPVNYQLYLLPSIAVPHPQMNLQRK